MLSSRARGRFIALGALFIFFGTSAFAQGNYPSRPIRLIVGFAAGSSNDLNSRTLAGRLAERLKRPVIVENIVGAGSAIGAQAVARADPDGYTIGAAAVALAIQAAIDPLTPVDLLNDFAPIALVGETTPILLVNPKLPAQNVKELVAYAKASPGKLFFGSAGFGSGLHMYGETFKQLAQIDIVHVPYKGEVQALTDVISGQLGMMFGTLSGSLSAIRNGNVRALAVSTQKRSTDLPDVPTMVESGLSTFVMSGWSGMIAPKNTPGPIVNRLANEIAAVLDEPETIAAYAKSGLIIRKSASPEEFAAFLKMQVALFKKASAGIKFEK